MDNHDTNPAHAEWTRAWYGAAVGTAVVAGAFSLLVAVALVFNNLQSRHADPLDSSALKQLKAALYQEPKNATIKSDIRALDVQLRKEYFRHRAFSKRGGYLLLGGIVVFLLALKSAAARRKKWPMPEAVVDDPEREAGARAQATRSVAASGLIVGSAALALMVASESDSTRAFWAAIEENKASATPEGGYPSREERRKHWPRFRGPGGLGISTYARAPSWWNGKTGEGILWKTPVPLPGENSPVVWEHHLFLTGATATKREVYCFDVDSGKLLWQRVVESMPSSPVEAPEVLEDTGFAAPSAATDGQRVYAIFANGDVASFDFAGKQVWTRNLGVPQNMYGHASSLAMYRNLLLVQLDQGSGSDGGSRLIAIDSRTGRQVWQTLRPVPNSWTSPIVINTETGDQIITGANPWVIAYDPATGAELWRAECLYGDAAPSPIYASGLVYAVQAGAYLAAIRPDGQGDVTETHIVWRAEESLPDICSPLSNDDLVFVLTSYGGVLTCYDARDGSTVWEKELGASFRSSPSLVGDRIYLMSQEGVMITIAASRDYRELGRAELGEASTTCPAFLDGRIYIRGREHLYGIGSMSEN